METFLVVVLIILCVIILMVLIKYLIKIWYRFDKSSTPKRLGRYCNMTSDCNLGLTCDQSICKIPISGSCVNREDMCAENGLCIKGMCKVRPLPSEVNSLPVTVQTSKIVQTKEIKTPIIINGVPSPIIISKLETPQPVTDDEEYDPETFHRLALPNGKVIVHDKNIIDASFAKDGSVWYITKRTVNVIKENNVTKSIYISGDNIGISCQAFNKVCYVLVKNNKNIFSIQKYNLSLEVEYPHFPNHEHINDCINLGISEAGLIMIVTKQSIISFNPNSLKENLSSWYVDSRDNKNILYMNHINGKLFSLNSNAWFYGDKQGKRVEDTFPVVEDETVENRNYWKRDNLYLSD